MTSDDEVIRNALADQMASAFIVELLLTQYLKGFAPVLRPAICETIRLAGRRTDQFTGLTAGDEHLSELLADVTTRMHDALDDYVRRALARLEAGAAAGP